MSSPDPDHPSLYDYDLKIEACPHVSASGISTGDFGSAKVWRCDGCGWLYVSVPTGWPSTYTAVDIEARLRFLEGRLAEAGMRLASRDDECVIVSEPAFLSPGLRKDLR